MIGTPLLCGVQSSACARPAGATSQDKNLHSAPVNPLKWKSPDRDIVINKSAGEKNELEIKLPFHLWAFTLNYHLTSCPDLRATLFP